MCVSSREIGSHSSLLAQAHLHLSTSVSMIDRYLDVPMHDHQSNQSAYSTTTRPIASVHLPVQKEIHRNKISIAGYTGKVPSRLFDTLHQPTMGEFSDDDEFADFDLDAAVAASAQYFNKSTTNTTSTNQQQNSKPSPTSMQNSHPNRTFSPKNANAAAAAKSATSASKMKRPSPKPYNSPSSSSSIKSAPGSNSSNDSNKKLKTNNTIEGDESSESALLLANELSAIPDSFKADMTSTLQTNFGHSMFRPGQLTVLHSLLGDGGKSGSWSKSVGKDTCVFWATG